MPRIANPVLKKNNKQDDTSEFENIHINSLVIKTQRFIKEQTNTAMEQNRAQKYENSLYFLLNFFPVNLKLL